MTAHGLWFIYDNNEFVIKINKDVWKTKCDSYVRAQKGEKWYEAKSQTRCRQYLNPRGSVSQWWLPLVIITTLKRSLCALGQQGSREEQPARPIHSLKVAIGQKQKWVHINKLLELFPAWKVTIYSKFANSKIKTDRGNTLSCECHSLNEAHLVHNSLCWQQNRRIWNS